MNVTKKKRHSNCSPKLATTKNWRENSKKLPLASKPIAIARASAHVDFREESD